MTRTSYREALREKEEQLRVVVEQVKNLQATVERQQRQITQLLERIYGKKSERFDPSQMHFDGLVIEAMDQAANGSVESAGEDADEKEEEDRPARRNRGYRRIPIPEHIERRTIVRDVPEAERQCGHCGEPRPCIGEDVTERLDCRPMTLMVNRYVTRKYGECRCGEGECGVKTAPAPHALIEKCSAEPSVIAMTLTQKFFDHLPFYRQEYIFQRCGVDVSRQTMWDWEVRVAEGIEPLYELLKAEAFSSGVCLSDDSPVRLVEEKGGSREGRIWVCLGGGHFEHCIYEFTTNRSQDGPKAFYRGYEGVLVSDGYGGYDPVVRENPGIRPAGCWCHARRYYHDALPTCAKEASEMLVLIGGLYTVERRAKGLAAADRQAMRQGMAVPQMKRIEDWVFAHQGKWLPKSPMGEAETYITNQWERLQVYLSDGRVPIDNSASERAIKPWAIGRKNWLFFFSERGGRAASVIMSFLQTCRLQGIEPWHYLTDIITRIAGHPMNRLQELLPHNWKPTHPEAVIHTPA
ncbi:MAG: IS66 family transposase [Planctomycetes bacterium]|jgi:transposase|nr:IS66 family transposase [Planctomycetota bacterium]